MKCRICNKDFPENIDGCIEKDFTCLFCFLEPPPNVIMFRMGVYLGSEKGDETGIMFKENIQG